MCVSWRNYSAQHGKPCSNKPFSSPSQTRPAQNHFLLGHAHSAQPLPKPRPAQSHTLLNHANHLLKLCPPALLKPCPKPALLQQALLKPRPAQTTTCSTMSCSTIPAPRPHPAQTTPCSNHTLLKPHPAQTTPCSNHTLLKPHPAQTTPRPSPAQTSPHSKLNHAHPLLYLTTPRPAQPCSTHGRSLLNSRPAPTKPCPNLASMPCYITAISRLPLLKPHPAHTTPSSKHAPLKPRHTLLKLLPWSNACRAQNPCSAQTPNPLIPYNMLNTKKKKKKSCPRPGPHPCSPTPPC